MTPKLTQTPKLTKILKYHIVSSLIYEMVTQDSWGDAVQATYDIFLEKVDMENLPVAEQKKWADLYANYTRKPSVKDFVLAQYDQVRFTIEDVPWILVKD